uniref:Uncharacterized protein n=1 Tax=Timema bartmani TaxID=61472 RepID=A0A7R9FCX1_9NEOP|nr:unnamed protein product [Timema bartmani]
MAHQYLYWRVTVQAQATGVHQSCRITDIVKEGNSAPAPVEDTADHDGLVVGVIASTPRHYRIMIQVFSCFTSPSYLLSWSL